jgi:hypothetical protein
MQIWHAAINDVTHGLEITGLIGIRRRIAAPQLTLGTGRSVPHDGLSFVLLFYAENSRHVFLGKGNFQCTA